MILRIFKSKHTIFIFLFIFVFQFFVVTTKLNAFSDNVPSNKDLLNSLFQDLQTVSTDPDAVNAMAQFYQENPSILTIFLDDMIQTMAAFANQDLFAPSLAPAEEFVDRWDDIEDSCPQCEVFLPIFNQILTEFSHQLELAPEEGNPLSDIFAFYQNMGQKDLNGFQSLFQLPWVEPRTKRLAVYEKKRITGYGKEEGVFIIQRQVLESVDGFLTFTEIILDDELVYYQVLQEEISFLHQALEEMIRDNIDPKAIRFVNRFVTLIDQEIALAHNNGNFDEFTYHYLYDENFQKENLVVSKHPLLKPPYRPDQFSVLTYYQ